MLIDLTCLRIPVGIVEDDPVGSRQVLSKRNNKRNAGQRQKNKSGTQGGNVVSDLVRSEQLHCKESARPDRAVTYQTNATSFGRHEHSKVVVIVVEFIDHSLS